MFVSRENKNAFSALASMIMGFPNGNSMLAILLNFAALLPLV